MVNACCSAAQVVRKLRTSGDNFISQQNLCHSQSLDFKAAANSSAFVYSTVDYITEYIFCIFATFHLILLSKSHARFVWCGLLVHPRYQQRQTRKKLCTSHTAWTQMLRRVLWFSLGPQAGKSIIDRQFRWRGTKTKHHPLITYINNTPLHLLLANVLASRDYKLATSYEISPTHWNWYYTYLSYKVQHGHQFMKLVFGKPWNFICQREEIHW
jgi:hypothetical protein